MKKAIALLLAAVMLLGLAGCGNSGESGSLAPESSAPQESAAAEETPIPEPTEEPAPTPEPVQDQVFAPAHGLIVAEAEVDPDTYIADSYTVYCIDPNSGEVNTVARFQVPECPEPGFYYSISLDGAWDANLDIQRHIFSDDYGKLCAAKVAHGTGEMFAGWIDTAGNFFDVTEALGMEHQDNSETPLLFVPHGFVGPYYGFTQQFIDTLNYNYNYVPVDNPVPSEIQEGKITLVGKPYGENGGLLGDEYMPKYIPTDVNSWIDGQRCIVDAHPGAGAPDTSVIVDASAGTEAEYIPGGDTENSNGVISPDGTEIAYTSRPLAYGSATGIYIIPVDGGDPVKVDIKDAPFELGIAGPCVLIDWQ